MDRHPIIIKNYSCYNVATYSVDEIIRTMSLSLDKIKESFTDAVSFKTQKLRKHTQLLGSIKELSIFEDQHKN